MKKTIYLSIILVLVLGLTKVLYATPSPGDPVIFTQPDASKITIILKGDEKCHWVVTPDGYTALFDKNGYYVYAIHDADGNLVPSDVVVHDPVNRTHEETVFLLKIPKGLLFKEQTKLKVMGKKKSLVVTEDDLKQYFPHSGHVKMPILLVGFQDYPFNSTVQNFNDYFNQPGYSYNGAQGSVHEYFHDVSYGNLDINFTVYGPYTLSHDEIYYSSISEEGYRNGMITEALALADADIDYTQYVNNGNGVVEGVFIIFAGVAASDGGPSWTLWPQGGGSVPNDISYDGVSFGKYGYSEELNMDSTITSIGTTCHEMTHVLGASDYYVHTDDGSYTGTGNWDLMASGCYNNSGNTPAPQNAYIRTKLFHWAAATLLDSTQMGIEMPNSAENLVFYYFETPVNNEFFIMENKSRVGYDMFDPGEGLLIYHMSPHPNSPSLDQFYPVSAIDSINSPSSIENINDSHCPFPGTSATMDFSQYTLPSTACWINPAVNAYGYLTDITYNESSDIAKFNFICTYKKHYNLNISALSCNQIKLTWQSYDNRNVIITSSTQNIQAQINSGVEYSAGDSLDFDNIVVYAGPANEFIHSGLESSTRYYYHVWTQLDNTFLYSTPDTISATTLGGIKNSITIRARGTQGTEHIDLLINGSAVGTGWKLTTGYQDYTAIVCGDGEIQVEFDNDATNRDVRIDYILVNGEKRQAEKMSYNTALYANGRCGGGSKSEWMNCNGVIGFGKTTDNIGTNTIVIRARGTQGGEHIDLLINGNAVNNGWWLSNSYQEFTATVEGNGSIGVEFDNDGTDKDVQIDWVKVNIQEPRQAENMGYNTGYYYNETCGGAAYSEWLNCNGVIGFDNISGNTSGGGDCNFTFPRTSALPSLNKQYNYMHVIGSSSTLSNVNKFTINWSLEHNGLWDMSYNTGNGIPNWYLSLMSKVTQTFASISPSITISGSGISILDGNYWVTMDGDNFVMVSKSGAYAIYCSNSATPPCSEFKSVEPSDIEHGVPFVNIYPNPSSGSISIAFEDPGSTAVVKLLDVTGRTVCSKTCSTDEVLQVNGLNKGIYFINIYCRDRECNKTVVVN